MRMFLDRRQGRTNTDGAKGRSIRRLGSFFCGVLDAEIKRVHADLYSHLIDSAFHGKSGHGCRRRSVGSHFWPVDQNVVTHGFNVLEVIAGIGRHRTQHRPGTGKRTILVAQVRGCCSDLTILFGTDLNVDGGRRRRSGTPEDFVPGHLEFDRTVRFARQRKRQRFHPDMGLAAESTADL